MGTVFPCSKCIAVMHDAHDIGYGVEFLKYPSPVCVTHFMFVNFKLSYSTAEHQDSVKNFLMHVVCIFKISC